MRRLAFAFVLAAFTSALVVFPVPASADRDDHKTKHHQKCPKGYHWVGGRNGHCVPRHRNRY
jgi:hypothetical protein